MYRDNPIMYVDTLLEKIMFEPSPLGWDIGGDDADILSMRRDDLVAFRNNHYHGKNLVVGVSGNIDEKECLKKVQGAFGASWERGTKANVCTPYRSLTQKKPRTLVYYKETEQIQVDLGFHGYSYTDSKSPAATLLAMILGGGMSSRLFIAIRERRGLCYSIHASSQNFLDTGAFSIQAGLDKTRVSEALSAIMKELHRIKTAGVTASELKRAKEHLKGKTAIALEDSENVVSWYVGQEVLTKKILTPEEKIAKLQKVSKEEVQKVAQQLFQTNRINLALIGPYKDDKEFLPLLKI